MKSVLDSEYMIRTGNSLLIACAVDVELNCETFRDIQFRTLNAISPVKDIIERTILDERRSQSNHL